MKLCCINYTDSHYISEQKITNNMNIKKCILAIYQYLKCLHNIIVTV